MKKRMLGLMLYTGKAITQVKLGTKIPLRVTHIVTNKCNLRCKYCYAESFVKEKEMDTQQIMKMMLEFKKAGTRIWKFGGGDPLLKENIGDLISFAKKCGFIVNLDTNGTLVENKLSILKGLDTVYLSLDGPEEIHDKIRGKGVFKKCISSIDSLKKIGIKPLINCVISKHNIGYIDFMVQLTKDKKTFINFQPVVPVTKEAKEEFSKEIVEKRVFDKIIKLKKKNKHIAVSTASLLRFKTYFEKKITKFQKNCLAGQIYCIVSPQGKVGRCIDELGSKNVDGLKYGFINAFHKLSKDYSCDCTFCCYYDLSRTYSFNPKENFKAAFNLLKGKWVYS